jgi:hypothetical protein
MLRVERPRQKKLARIYAMKVSRNGIVVTVFNGSSYIRQSDTVILHGLWMERRG